MVGIRTGHFPGVSADAWPFTHPALSEVGGRFSLRGGRYECHTRGFFPKHFFCWGMFFFSADTKVCHWNGLEICLSLIQLTWDSVSGIESLPTCLWCTVGPKASS